MKSWLAKTNYQRFVERYNAEISQSQTIYLSTLNATPEDFFHLKILVSVHFYIPFFQQQMCSVQFLMFVFKLNDPFQLKKVYD